MPASTVSAENYDLAFNPFADDPVDLASSESRPYYSSALHPKHQIRPVRRRKSSGSDSASFSNSESSKRHSRSRTDSYSTRNGAAIHPLRSAGLHGNTSRDGDITRPHLSRIVRTGTLVDAPSADSSNMSVSPTSSEIDEKDVLVHEISSKDSLAGVSLKYGISLADLRRANHLWTSDTIHLRKVLYIPIEKASRASEYMPETTLISFTPDASVIHDPLDSVQHAGSTLSSENNTSQAAVSVTKTGTVRRIPASQLSYFPPPSVANKALATSGGNIHANIEPQPSLNSKTALGHLRYTSSPASNSLTSILTALPIAASTRDDLISRLSFDSVSSSYSDSHRSESDQDAGHELEEVKRRRRSRQAAEIRHDAINSAGEDDVQLHSMTTPKATRRPPSGNLPTKTSSQAISSPPQVRREPSLSSTNPPISYIPQKQSHSTIRTVQLEPSPGMMLPAKDISVERIPARARSGRMTASSSMTNGHSKLTHQQHLAGNNVELGNRHEDDLG